MGRIRLQCSIAESCMIFHAGAEGTPLQGWLVGCLPVIIILHAALRSAPSNSYQLGAMLLPSASHWLHKYGFYTALVR